MTTNESLLKVIIGTWFSGMSRAGLGLNVLLSTLEQKATMEDSPALSNLMVTFKTPLILDLSLSYLNINCKLFTVKATNFFKW